MTDSRRALTKAWKQAPEVSTPFRVPGLDGVRAIAVAVVILFHLTPGTTIGGYLGVDVFFVVSGFLITSLLLRERAASGRVSLRAFWSRRARRLLPALGILILACGATAALIGGDVLVGLGAQVVGAATFSSNWLLLADGSDYFGAGLPELFRNLWSLALEEQFYLIWPLLLVLVLVRMPSWVRPAVVTLLAAASAFSMAALWTPADPSRVYYGTDTHAFGLAIGAVLAFLAVSWPRHALEWPRAVRISLGIAGPVSLAGLLTLAVLMPFTSPTVFRGGLVLVALLTAVVIAALLVPATPMARVLERAPFRWVGLRSYGLYLWHWPVFVLLFSALPGWPRGGAGGWAVGALALAITVVVAALSYRFVEQPIRRLGFGGALRAVRDGWRTAAPHALRRRVAMLTATLLLVAAASGTVVAIASDPGVGQAQLAIEAGQRAIRDAATNSPTPSALAPTPTPTATSRVVGPATGPEITAIGDSVMLASAPELESRFPGISIDAVVSRRLPAGLDIVRADRAAGTLRRVVVVGLATNGPISLETLQQLRAAVGRDRELVVVNAQAPRGWIDPNNSMLSEFAASHRNVELADWHAAAQPILSYLAGDQIHFGPTGARVYTDSIQSALTGLSELAPLQAFHPKRSRHTPS